MMPRPFHETLPSQLPSPSDWRLALVIGNGRYIAEKDVLANPGNDAAGVAAALTRLGFYGVRPVGNGYDVDFAGPGVVPLVDLDMRHMRGALSAMSRAAGPGVRQIVIYYAGHGIEVDGKNYLIPTDAKLGHSADAQWEAILLDSILGPLQGGGGLRLVILDACRNNPFRVRLFPGRGGTVGLRSIELASSDTLVFYAAKHGTVASDGKAGSRNSPFAEALLKHIETPGLEIMQLIREVKDDVLEATQGEQEPYVYGSLGRRAEYFAPPRPAPSSQEAASTATSHVPASGVAPDRPPVKRLLQSIKQQARRSRRQRPRQRRGCSSRRASPLSSCSVAG
jgi:uncharacterized caspase-like protein